MWAQCSRTTWKNPRVPLRWHHWRSAVQWLWWKWRRRYMPFMGISIVPFRGFLGWKKTENVQSNSEMATSWRMQMPCWNWVGCMSGKIRAASFTLITWILSPRSPRCLDWRWRLQKICEDKNNRPFQKKASLSSSKIVSHQNQEFPIVSLPFPHGFSMVPLPKAPAGRVSLGCQHLPGAATNLLRAAPWRWLLKCVAGDGSKLTNDRGWTWWRSIYWLVWGVKRRVPGFWVLRLLEMG